MLEFLIKKSNFIFQLFGLQLSYLNKSEQNKYKWLKKFNIDTVIDVGANEGQFASKINKAIQPSIIYSFEPTSGAYKKLSSLSAKMPNIKPFQLGLGEKNETLYININSYSPSSSILELAEIHKKSYPDFVESSKEEIIVKSLDSLIETDVINLNNKQGVLLKIDVQGFEKFVLNGAQKTLKAIKMIYLEVSFIEMYQNQPLFSEIYTLLAQEGFRLIGVDNLASDEKSAQPLFVDAYFIRN